MAGGRMDPGKIYKTWVDFKEALDAHCRENFVVFKKRNGKSVEAANRQRSVKPFFDPALKYSQVLLQCKHFGKYRSHSAGIRPNQRSYKINCQAFISIAADRVAGQLIVKDAYHKHSHPCTAEIFNSYPENRRISLEECKLISRLMDMGVSLNQIKQAIGKKVLARDLCNAKRRYLNSVNAKGASGTGEGVSGTGQGVSGTGEGVETDEDVRRSKRRRRRPRHADEDGDDVDEGDDNGADDDTQGGGVELDATDDLNKLISETESKNKAIKEVFASARKSLDDLDPSQSINLKETTVSARKLNVRVDDIRDEAALMHVKTEVGDVGNHKDCSICGRLLSPLDGHSVCLYCLGPDHLDAQFDCVHCQAIPKEQLTLRRKRLIKMRLDMLSNPTPNSKKRARPRSDAANDVDDYDFSRRKVSRMSHLSPHKMNQCIVQDGQKHYYIQIPKKEVMDDYEDAYDLDESNDLPSENSERFEHLLKQTKVFDDVMLAKRNDGTLCFAPDHASRDVFSRVMYQSHTPVAAAPRAAFSRYLLSEEFEKQHFTIPSKITSATEPHVEEMSEGLEKLAKNSVVHSRIAIYDKLFTRLGLGMADEALSLLTDLNNKVNNVTEISQEDLTNDLQTASDTIQALKDVLEELGIMSADALNTAAHQRKLCVSSLNSARQSFRHRYGGSDGPSPRKRKFQPFALSRATNLIAEVPIDINSEVLPEIETSSVEATVVENTPAIQDLVNGTVVSVSIPQQSNPATFAVADADQLAMHEGLAKIKDGIIEVRVLGQGENMPTEPEQGHIIALPEVQTMPNQ